MEPESTSVEDFWKRIPKEDLDKTIDHKHGMLRGQRAFSNLERIVTELKGWELHDIAAALELTEEDVANITRRYADKRDQQK